MSECRPQNRQETDGGTKRDPQAMDRRRGGISEALGVRPASADAAAENWRRQPSDRRLRSSTLAKRLAPSEAAELETQIRRVSLDVIGLPPTPAEIDLFPRRAERIRNLHMPNWWIGCWQVLATGDAGADGGSIRLAMPTATGIRSTVRADLGNTGTGSDRTERRSTIDQFTIEQLAGDLTPNATIDQKIATGFHRNTQINQEGGVDPEQFRIESVFDRDRNDRNRLVGAQHRLLPVPRSQVRPDPAARILSVLRLLQRCRTSRL